MPRYLRLIMAAGVATVAALAMNVAPASATVATRPASWTPNVTSANANVRQLAQCGATMYAVGSFSQVTQGGHAYTRNNAFSFSATTGAVTGWSPNVNGVVNSVAFSLTCKHVYLGGVFTKSGATAVKNLAAVTPAPTTGAVIPGFGHNTNGAVNTVAVVNSGKDVLVGGAFTSLNNTARPYYASLDVITGKVNSYLTFAVAGILPPNAGATMVYNQQVSPTGHRLLFEGDFTTIGGQPRLQVAEVDLSTTRATLDAWHNATLNSTFCDDPDEQFYVRDAAFSPTDRTIYLATTGSTGSSGFCDALVSLTNTPTAPVKWINKTGGDSLYSVADGQNDVYIGGHQRWANNPQGANSCGPGCVPRQGIGDISAVSGLATSWNPGRARGHGADDLLITPAGLWIASDTTTDPTTGNPATQCGGVYHPGICFFPGAA